LTGMVLCGVLTLFKRLEILSGNEDVKKMIEAGRSNEDGSAFMGIMLADMTGRYENSTSELDWVVSNPVAFAEYLTDPLVNLTRAYTVQFFYDICD
jgi:hypothetical protein